jgi:hypothetical protein
MNPAECGAVWYYGSPNIQMANKEFLTASNSSMHHRPTSHAKPGRPDEPSGHQNVTERCAELLALNVKPARATRNSLALEAI